MFAQEVLVESLGVTLAKQFCDLLLQNRLHCLRHVLTVRHWKQTQILQNAVCFLSHVRKRYVPLCTSFEESHQTLWSQGDRGPMSKLSSPTAASKDTSLQTQMMSYKSWNIMNHYVQVHQYAHLSWGRSQRPSDACLFYSLLSSWEESGNLTASSRGFSPTDRKRHILTNNQNIYPVK